MRWLVTGWAGFIGGHLVERLAGRAAVRVLDDFRTGSRANLAGLACETIEGSILDPGALAQAMEGVDVVAHLAALVSVQESIVDPETCLSINTTGTLRVLAEAARRGVKALVFASSAAVYGDDPAVPVGEDAAPRPLSPYALSKFDGECLCGMFGAAGRLRTVCLRFFNVFGPRQDPKSPYASVVPVFTERARRGEPLVVCGDGEQTRDFVHVRDVARAIEHFASRPDLEGVFNIGTGRGTTVNELAARLAARAGVAVEHGPARPGEVRHSVADVRRAAAAGFAASPAPEGIGDAG